MQMAPWQNTSIGTPVPHKEAISSTVSSRAVVTRSTPSSSAASRTAPSL